MIAYSDLPTNAKVGATAEVINDWSTTNFTEFTFTDDYGWQPTPGQTILEIDYRMTEPIFTFPVEVEPTEPKMWGEYIEEETGTAPPAWLAEPRVRTSCEEYSSIDWGDGDVFGTMGATCGGMTASCGTGPSPTGVVKIWKLKIYS